MSNTQQWKNQLGFLLSALGSAVGLGNIWRFAYLAYSNGGGSFVLVYILALLCVGIPLLVLEFGCGHYFRKAAPGVFRAVMQSEWVGWLTVLLSFVLTTFYPVILAWCLLFFVYSFGLGWGTDTNKFFHEDFLQLSSGAFHLEAIQGDILIATVVIWLMTWAILVRGVKGLELANKICMPLLFVFLSILVFWSLSLEGSIVGVTSYFSFDLSAIWETKLWVNALGQVFFSLSIGYGVMMVYASYLGDKADITRASLVTGLLDSGFAIFSGIAIFAVLGFMATQEGIAIDEVVQQGPGLAFVIYTQALNIMASNMGEVMAKIFGIIFFSCLFLAGLSSLIALVETYASAWITKYKMSRQKGIVLGVLAGFLTNVIFTTHAGFYWLDIVDHFIVNYGILISGILECVVLGWVFRLEDLRKHVNNISRIQLGRWWNITIKVIIPVFLLINTIRSLYNEFQAPYGSYPSETLLIIGFGSMGIFLLMTWFFSRKVAETP